DSRIGTGGSRLCRRLNIFSPNFLFLTGISAKVRGYLSAAHRGFPGAASALN
ncbi:hypothetical protein HAX54_028181, partial [Datura stramonium]|nr:hypothetical protein [Datura stramonium]